MDAAAMSKIPRLPDTFRWRLAIGAVLIVGSYLAWLIIPLVVSSGLSPEAKTALTALLGATPLATKFIAVALLGRPTINYLKKHPLKLFRRESGPAD
jgi:branched-subunit amino acid ABC-type transport system permease component